jgi:hypothetical protein
MLGFFKDLFQIEVLIDSTSATYISTVPTPVTFIECYNTIFFPEFLILKPIFFSYTELIKNLILEFPMLFEIHF